MQHKGSGREGEGGKKCAKIVLKYLFTQYNPIQNPQMAKNYGALYYKVLCVLDVYFSLAEMSKRVARTQSNLSGELKFIKTIRNES